MNILTQHDSLNIMLKAPYDNINTNSYHIHNIVCSKAVPKVMYSIKTHINSRKENMYEKTSP